MKHLVGRLTWGLLMALSLAACMDREFDQNDEYTNSQSIPLVADNKLLLSRIYIINESKSYLWFDLNNEVANFSKPELTLPLKEGNRDSYRRIPLRGLLYEYHDTEKELTFKNIPSQFIQIGDEQLSLIFKLSLKILPKNKKGFSLLEMIIVVIVLGILMAAGIYRL